MSFCCLNPTDEDDRSFLDLSYGTEIPVKNRKQTDFPFFVTLVVLFSFLVICVSVAGSQGDIRRFVHGYDSKGNLCGFKNEPIKGIEGTGLDLTDKKYLQTTKTCELSIDSEGLSTDICLTSKQCVERCENGYALWIIPICKVISNNDSVGTYKSFLAVIYSDLSLCWREIIVLCFCSIFLSGLIMTALRMFAKVAVRVIIIIISLVAIGWTAFTWMMVIVKAVERNNAVDQSKKVQEMQMYNWMYLGVVSTVFTGLFFYMLYKMRNKLPLISVLFEEGGKCIKDIPTMLLQPILTHLVTAAFTCFLIIGIICLQTSGKADVDDNGKVSFPVNIFFQITSWLLIFAFLWLSQFFLACQNIVVAGAVSSWYFLRVKGKLTDPVWRSFCTLVKHHLGSSAFGSLIIAIIKNIRIIAKMMERRSRSNGLAVLIWGIMRCILACMESILRILNKSAYVMIALFGEPFCSSARRAFACLTSDSSKIALLIGVGTFILTAIELMITATVTFIGIAIFMNIEGVEIFWIPATLVFILSYLCCHCFFSVYEMTIDTLILCFCVDHQMNDGVEKPYYMNSNLMVLLNEEESDSANPNADGDQNMLVVT